MKLGLSSWAYTWAIGVPGHLPEQPLTASDLLQKAIDNDVHLVQIADNLPLHKLPDSQLEALVQHAEANGIDIEVGARGITPEHLQTYLQLARRFNSPLVRVVIDTPDGKPSVPEAISLLQESLPDFVDANIILALENHDYYTTHDFVQMLETINNPYLGICLDTVNSFGALEGPEVVVDALAPWTVNLHIKDFSIRRGEHYLSFIIEGTPAGQGRLNVPWLLEKLATHNRSLNAILEFWTPPEPSLAETIAKENKWAQESVAYLRQFISG
jgi:sugar phosphate isomerase/epimerase